LTSARPLPSRWMMTAVVVVTIVALYTVDVLLARVEKGEVQNEAARLYQRGEALLASGHAADAIDPLQHAFTLDRNNRQYQLGYAESLIVAGRREDAAAQLNDVMRRSPNDGRANLLLARLARANGDLENESAYYHRAIYGVWNGDSAGAKADAARLEWIRELAARGDHKMLLGELLPLAAENHDFAVLTEVAKDLRIAGSPNRSAELYRTLIETHPDDASLWKGLGEAQTAAGEYGAARSALVRAFQLDPHDASVRHDMELASALSAIDPSLRRLPSRAKFERSTRVLKLVRDTVAACGVSPAELADADRRLAAKSTDMSNEGAEEVLQTAESLWAKRAAGCAAPELLPVLMQKLAQ
jgi:tetratricopeptide (TPR) repeat protein